MNYIEETIKAYRNMQSKRHDMMTKIDRINNDIFNIESKEDVFFWIANGLYLHYNDFSEYNKLSDDIKMFEKQNDFLLVKTKDLPF